jgi:hypothetical protein
MMPAPADPHKLEFYVYQFEADGYPFYVGIGRAERASNRERFIRSLLKHHPEKLQSKSLKDRVMAELIRMKREFKYREIKTGMKREEALALEKEQIRSLAGQGYLLTNWHHNLHRHRDAKRAVEAILAKHRFST